MITINRLTKTIKEKTIIENLSFDIPPGGKYCLFAPSGAGKSTLIRILSGVDSRFKGTVHIGNAQKATVFQEAALLWYKTVQENIFYPFKLNRLPIDSTVRERYKQWIAITGLSGYETYYPYEISGGMKQKAAIIRAFLLQPELVLLDEPFSSIDAASKLQITEQIRQDHPDITSLLVTHYPDEIPLLADTTLVFPQSKLSQFTLERDGEAK